MRPHLKWHKLRRRRNDAPFWRPNLAAGLIAGAALEVDVVVTADGHILCLHDLTLDAETTGRGPVGTAKRAEIERLYQRGNEGEALDSPPLFLDEVVATVARFGQASGQLVQLDIKEPAIRFDDSMVAQLARITGLLGHRFIASGYDGMLIERLCRAVPGLAGGFDPLKLYDLNALREAGDFETVAVETLRRAPNAVIYYLEADLVMRSLDFGVNLVERVTRNGALVDAWTVDANRPHLRQTLHRLVEAGVSQITTNDSDQLSATLQAIR